MQHAPPSRRCTHDRAVAVDGRLQGIVFVRLADVKQVDQAVHASRGHAVGLGRVELDLMPTGNMSCGLLTCTRLRF